MKKFFYAAMAVVALATVWSCGDDEDDDLTGRPNTEQNGGRPGNNNGGNTGENTGGGTNNQKPAGMVKFTTITVDDIAYNKATLNVAYELENVDASSKAKLRIRKVSAPEYLEESGYDEMDLDLSGKMSIPLSLYQKQSYVVRVDAVVGDKVYKSDVVSFTAPEKPYIAVTSITLSQTTMTLKVGQKEPLYAYIVPADASKTSVSWLYYDTTIAQSFHGVITIPAKGNSSTVVEALKPGKMKIEAKSEDGGFKATCEVTVVE